MRGFIIRRPVNMHCHFRDGDMLKSVLPYTSKVFYRGVAMGNLFPYPIKTVEDALGYKKRILAVDPDFQPEMTIMLTPDTTEKTLVDAANSGIRVVKIMDAGATTNSAFGINLREVKKYYPLFEVMQYLKMIASGHWEVKLNFGQDYIKEMAQELAAIPILKKTASDFSQLLFIFEHVSTKEGVEFVKNSPENVRATITLDHMLTKAEDVFNSEFTRIINPLLFCKPVPKRHADVCAVRQAATSCNPKFFFGDDTAPHLVAAKLKSGPSPGTFTAPVSLPLLCKVFAEENAITRFENFTSVFGPEAYGWPASPGEITIRWEKWRVPEEIDGIPVFWGGKKLEWIVE